MQQNLIMNLADGRQLAFAEYGDPDGFPVFFVHGFPSSRLQAADFHIQAQTKHCRFLGVDRPGMGLSSVNQRHSLLSWAQDVRELADHLGVQQFSLLAHSGGAPFALACAYMLPKRVLRMALVAGIAPTTIPESKVGINPLLRVLMALARNNPPVCRMFLQLLPHLFLKPSFFKKIIQILPAADRSICQKPEQMHRLIMTATEAFKSGVEGAAAECQLLLNTWGFDLENIHTPIKVWHGRLDSVLPISHAKIYEHLLPEVQCKIFDNEAHLSALYHHVDEIFDFISDNQAYLKILR